VKYLIDTNVCIAFLNRSVHAVCLRMAREDPADIAVSAVTIAELTYGAHRGRRSAATLRALDEFTDALTVLPLDAAAARHAGRVRADLEARGRPIGPNDLLIAATALSHDLTLVTHNSREFGRVSGLRTEDWEA
jgi:tRNA(fMet)-specific endonuclease VapC